MTVPLLLFAAGFGTRMGALTRDRPKAMVEVAGRPLIDHAAGLARAAGIGTVVANTHYRADVIGPHLERLGIAVSQEPGEILDTGGGLRHALPLLGPGPVMTLNTDAVFSEPNPLTTLCDNWREDMEALLLVVPVGRARGRGRPGDFSLTDGYLARGGDFVFTGAQIIRPDVLDAYDARVFSLSPVWTDLAARGALRGVVHPGAWVDVGHPAGIAEAEAVLDRV